MTTNKADIRNNNSMMNVSYYCYFKACYFAGLYRRAVSTHLPDIS